MERGAAVKIYLVNGAVKAGYLVAWEKEGILIKEKAMEEFVEKFIPWTAILEITFVEKNKG